MSEPIVHRFQAEVTQVLRLVINSLYSNPDVFLRELVSNASDALDKLRFRAISEPELLDADASLRVRIVPDREAGTLTIEDNGIGMTAAELEKNLGTVAWSGSRDFVERIRSAGAKPGESAEDARLRLIGQFGVGFYSAFLVADRVDVVSRAAGHADASRWSSDGRESFSIEAAERAERGTSVVLHLKPELREELTTGHQLRRLVERYSDYVGHPIELMVERSEKGEKHREFQKINEASALWQRSPSEVTEAQYAELYKHLSHDWEGPLAWRHFRIEGTQMFSGIVFIPKRRPFDLFDASAAQKGLRLHVQRVFVMDDADALLPRWLRFVRGVVDSEDLPLNVSREVLQDSKLVKLIKKQVIHQTLDLLEEIARDKPEDYAKLWADFGAVIKEGFHFDPDLSGRIAKLFRAETTDKPGLLSLDEYVDAMPAEQPAIYYATGLEKSVIAASPHLEALKRRSWNVLLLTDPVDPFAVEALEKYRDKPLVSVSKADLKLPEDAAREADRKAREAEAAPVLDRFKSVLAERVSEVRASDRLTDSPVCLVVPEGGLEAHIERMLRAARQQMGPTKRILEVNLTHPLVQGIAALDQPEGQREDVEELIKALYDQALLAEGSPVEDPARLARQLTRLLTQAVAQPRG
jgi:molecular chaperone HtpG